MEDAASHQVIDLRQSDSFAKYLTRTGWTVEDAAHIRVFVRKIGPVSVAKIQRVDLPLPWGEVDRVLKKYRVFMCKLEPRSGDLRVLGRRSFRKDGWPLLGTKTLLIDLTGSEESIWSSFKKDARYCLRQAAAYKYRVDKNSFDRFYKIWSKAAKIKKLWIPGKRNYDELVKAFGKNCFAITVSDLAGALILTADSTAYYYYSAALPEGKKRNLPYLVIREAMREAKKRGCQRWDFEGIYDSRWPNTGWKGFSHFKKSFGGVEMEMGGSYIRWLWPF